MAAQRTPEFFAGKELTVGIIGSRHSGEANSVPNDEVDFTVRESLRVGRPQVGSAWIEIRTRGRVTCTVQAVTTRTPGKEQFATLLGCSGIVLQRIAGPSICGRDREVPNEARGARFHCRRRGSCPKAIPNRHNT